MTCIRNVVRKGLCADVKMDFILIMACLDDTDSNSTVQSFVSLNKLVCMYEQKCHNFKYKYGSYSALKQRNGQRY